MKRKIEKFLAAKQVIACVFFSFLLTPFLFSHSSQPLDLSGHRAWSRREPANRRGGSLRLHGRPRGCPHGVNSKTHVSLLASLLSLVTAPCFSFFTRPCARARPRGNATRSPRRPRRPSQRRRRSGLKEAKAATANTKAVLWRWRLPAAVYRCW